jgi:hypothetical protein
VPASMIRNAVPQETPIQADTSFGNGLSCDWPEVVVRDSIVAHELGTQANPIVIGDDLAPLGSASNSIVIQVDEGWCHDDPDQLGSDADTEVMATPQFWGTLTSGIQRHSKERRSRKRASHSRSNNTGAVSKIRT